MELGGQTSACRGTWGISHQTHRRETRVNQPSMSMTFTGGAHPFRWTWSAFPHCGQGSELLPNSRAKAYVGAHTNTGRVQKSSGSRYCSTPTSRVPAARMGSAGGTVSEGHGQGPLRSMPPVGPFLGLITSSSRLMVESRCDAFARARVHLAQPPSCPPAPPSPPPPPPPPPAPAGAAPAPRPAPPRPPARPPPRPRPGRKPPMDNWRLAMAPAAKCGGPRLYVWGSRSVIGSV